MNPTPLYDYIQSFAKRHRMAERERIAKFAGVTAHAIRTYESGHRIPRDIVAERIEAITAGKVKASELLP